MIEQFTSPVAVNNSQEPWLVGEGVVVSGGVAIPSLDFDFITGGLPGTVTFTRASSATYFDSTGTLQTAGNNVARFDYNPATLAARGLLIEEQRTNGIRNNTMQGAVAGTPGTLPTNWSIGGSGLGTLTQQIVGTGSVNGISYIDFRLSGTTSTTDTAVVFEQPTTIAAATGQSWTQSSWFSIVSGSTSNITSIILNVVERTSAGGAVTQQNLNILPTLTSSLTRITAPYTLSGGATVAYVQPRLLFGFSSGVAIDITLRIGLPQLEQGAFATSVIPTTTTALTRSADVASVNTLSPWFNSTVGTIYVEASNAQVQASLFSTDDGTASNRIITYFNVANSPAFRVVSGGVDQCNYSAGTITQNAAFKLAAAYQVNDFAASLNGAAVVTDTSGTIPTGQTTARIGTNVSLANSINGYLRRITYYPRRLSNAELQTLTT